MTYARLIFFSLALPLLYAMHASAAVPAGPADLAAMAGQSNGVINRDLYLAGKEVNIHSRVNGDAVVAGGRVAVDNQVTGDVIAAGGRIDIRAAVLDDVRAAGGEINVSNNVNGDVIAAGGHIRLDELSSVGERAWLAGGEIEVNGRVGKELRAAGNEITLSGWVDGNAMLFGDSIRIMPTAHITGNLIYHSADKAQVSDQAVIVGNVSHLPAAHEQDHAENHGVALIGMVALFIMGMACYLLYPDFTHATLRTLRERPAASLGFGALVTFVTPPVILVLLTVIGSLLGVVILLLYPVILLLGFLTGALLCGGLLLRLDRQPQDEIRGKRVLSLAAVLFILWLLGFLPVIGEVLIFTATLFGVGALKLQMYSMYRASHRPEARS